MSLKRNQKNRRKVGEVGWKVHIMKQHMTLKMKTEYFKMDI